MANSHVSAQQYMEDIPKSPSEKHEVCKNTDLHNQFRKFSQVTHLDAHILRHLSYTGGPVAIKSPAPDILRSSVSSQVADPYFHIKF